MANDIGLNYSMIPKDFSSEVFWSDYKASLYSLPPRRKLRAIYSDDLQYKINILNWSVPNIIRTRCLSNEQILETFNNFKR